MPKRLDRREVRADTPRVLDSHREASLLCEFINQRQGPTPESVTDEIRGAIVGTDAIQKEGAVE